MATTRNETIEIGTVNSERLQVWAIGTSPILMNRMSQKARRIILTGQVRLTGAGKASHLKHDPIAEYQASPYRLDDPNAPTLLAVMSSAFKGAAMTAALDLPDVRKATIGRLLWVAGEMTPVFGIPRLHMSITRSADINRTPDVRTRAILSQWAAPITVEYLTPIINQTSVINLLSAAGMTAGVGDWRPEKGKGNYGQFRLTDRNDPALRQIIETGGRAAQIEALTNPVAYDSETRDLLAWSREDAARRGMTITNGGELLDDVDAEDDGETD